MASAESAVIKALLGYEVVAYRSGGRLPTLTEIARAHPVVGGLIVGGLAWHFRPSATLRATLGS